MRIDHIVRHEGASFTDGAGSVHLWTSGVTAQRLRAAWDQCLVSRGLAESLTTRAEPANGSVHGVAETYPFLPLDVITQALGSAARGGRPDTQISESLEAYASDARLYRRSYGLFAEIARSWGWVAQPFRLGFMPALLLGAGRHARILAMNIGEGVSAPIAMAGTNKAFNRDFLAAHGLPVPRGSLVDSPDRAVESARALGFPVVLKRLVGGNSDGVLVGLRTAAAVRSGARRLLARDAAILVEGFVAGTELRLHFVAGRLHRVYHAAPHEVTGDGRRTLGALIAARHPAYWRAMSAAKVHRDRLVLALWTCGVRRFADLQTIVPAKRTVVRVSAATGSGMALVDAKEFFRVSEVQRLERFLERHGSPSCGMDVIVSTPRVPLEEGTCILELNVPCGFGYLDDPTRVAAFELQEAVRGDRAFQRQKGRVPVWLVLEEQAQEATVWRRVRAAFGRHHPHGVTRVVRGRRAAWTALLNVPEADALLIRLSADAILEHGIPANLAPRLMFNGSVSAFRRAFPIACRTAAHAGGRLVAIGNPTLSRAT